MEHRRNIVLCYFEKQMAAHVRIEKEILKQVFEFLTFIIQVTMDSM